VDIFVHGDRLLGQDGEEIDGHDQEDKGAARLGPAGAQELAHRQGEAGRTVGEDGL
jgi:hypothetical protein